jgi:hypothetical protein
MKKNAIFSVISIFACILIFNSSCENASIRESSEDSTSFEPNTDTCLDTDYYAETVHIEEEKGEAIPIIVDVDVDVSRLNDIKTIELSADGENYNRIVEEWFLSNYPDAKIGGENAYSCGKAGSERFVQFGKDGLGNIYFIDTSKDINGRMEQGRPLFNGYITKEIPLGMSINSETAEKEAIDFIKRFTAFDYRANKIIAVNDVEGNQGYYDIYLKAYINGLPICVARSGDSTLIPISLNYKLSSKGIISFDGNVNFKIVETKALGNRVQIEPIVDQFIKDIETLASEEYDYSKAKVTVSVKDHKFVVNNIYLGYIPEKEKSSNSSVTLVPAWCFDYVDSRTENGEEIIIYFTVAYSVETGRWMGRFY